MHTPLGTLTLSELDGAIVAVDWGWGRDQADTALLAAARDQLHEYFDGERGTFELPLRLDGSDYARSVLAAVQAIPPGQTLTYAELAAQTGGTASGVGRVLAANPLPILIPSHRVVGKAGLGPYPEEAGGRQAKRFLLALEKRWAERDS